MQLRLNIEAVIGSAYPSFGFGRRNSVGSNSKLRILVINLASVPARQLVNFSTAQSLGSWLRAKARMNFINNYPKTILLKKSFLFSFGPLKTSESTNKTSFSILRKISSTFFECSSS